MLQNPDLSSTCSMIIEWQSSPANWTGDPQLKGQLWYLVHSAFQVQGQHLNEQSCTHTQSNKQPKNEAWSSVIIRTINDILPWLEQSK